MQQLNVSNHDVNHHPPTCGIENVSLNQPSAEYNYNEDDHCLSADAKRQDVLIYKWLTSFRGGFCSPSGCHGHGKTYTDVTWLTAQRQIYNDSQEKPGHSVREGSVSYLWLKPSTHQGTLTSKYVCQCCFEDDMQRLRLSVALSQLLT